MSKRKTIISDQRETISVEDAFTTFIVSRQALNLAPATLLYYNKRLQPFITWCSKNKAPTIDLVAASHVRTYLVSEQKRGIGAYTLHGIARAVKAFLRFCAADDLIVKAPTFAMPKLPKDVLPAFEPADVKKLLAACDNARDRAIVQFLLDTGVRASEFVNLNGGDIDLMAGSVRVRLGKGRKSRTVYMGGKTKRALLKYWQQEYKPAATDPAWVSTTTGQRLTDSGLQQTLVRLGKKAEVEHCHAHTFRRTFALWSLRAGMDVYVLARLMGHADLQVLSRYLDLDETDAKAAHAKHGAVDSIL